MSDPKFAPVGEVPISRAIVEGFLRDFREMIESDVLIVGAGPSGLVAGMDLSKAGFKVVIVEETNYLGGGFWMGGYLMNKVTVRKPGHTVLEEIGCPYEEVEEGLCVIDAAHGCAKLIAAACDAGVKFLQMTRATDLVLRNGHIVTVDSTLPEAQAVAVRGYEIIAVGTDDEIDAYIGEETEVVDLNGRLAVPGFI